jgi:uncharacterized membrane protein
MIPTVICTNQRQPKGETVMATKSRSIAASALVSAVGLALAASVAPAAAQMNPTMQKKLEEVLKKYPDASKTTIEHNMERVAKYHLQKCYGINAVGMNDCASGTHSCAGQATMARDPKSFVLLPTGDCSKIAGGELSPS